MNATASWIEIRIEADPLLLEELSPILFNLGCQGINEYEKSFALFFPGELWNDAKKIELGNVLAKKKITPAKISYHSVIEENWNEKWKENFKIFRIGKNIIVQPDWEDYKAKAGEKVLTIIPKMAFGTGHHETTQLILKQLEKMVQPGMSVLDAGTGTAILAIGAARLGAGNIVAFDTDPVAIDNAGENIMLNNVADKIDLRCCTLQDIERDIYDLIVANINRNILLELAADFNNYARPGTLLILSGLLVKDHDTLRKEYSRTGWQEQGSDEQGEWLCLNFVKI